MARRSDESQAPPLDAELNRLFQLPLDEFTGARNALAAQLKKEGRRHDAALIQSTPKPSVSAWAVNKVWWSARDAFQAMLDAGERLRDVQKSSLTGRPADLRGAVEAHQQAVRAVVDAAVDALGGADRVSAPIRQRIASTCEAIASLAVPEGVVLGRLTEDLQPVGFAALSGFLSLAPTTGGAKAPGAPPVSAPTKRPPAPSADRARPGAVVEDLAARRREQAQAREREARLLAAREFAAATGKALAAAEAELAAETRRAEEAVSARDAASTRLKDAEAALERARAEHAAALRDIEERKRGVAEKRTARERAARAAQAAQQKLDRLT